MDDIDNGLIIVDIGICGGGWPIFFNLWWLIFFHPWYIVYAVILFNLWYFFFFFFFEKQFFGS